VIRERILEMGLNSKRRMFKGAAIIGVVLLMILGVNAFSSLIEKTGNSASVIQEAQASDYKNFKHPLFIDVERVFVHVEYHTTAIKGKEIPKPLHRENVEEEILRAYKGRFSSKDCQKWLENKNFYSCDDQPVILVPFEERSNYKTWQDTSFATARELRDKGTLHVILIINITGNYSRFDPPLEHPLISYYTIQERPSSKLPISYRIKLPVISQLNQTVQKIKKELYGHIAAQIH